MQEIKPTSSAQPATETPTIEPTIPPIRYRGLVARWRMIDGKLTCQWYQQPD